jgi:hypothetical protein
MHTSKLMADDALHARADQLCRVLDLCYCRDGAEAEVRGGVYTGRITLSAAATAKLIGERAELESRIQQLTGAPCLEPVAESARQAQLREGARRVVRPAWGL